MPYNRNQDNEIRLAPGVDALTKLEAMRGGPQTPTFFDETKHHIYGSAMQRQFKMFEINLPVAINTHPLTQRPLFEVAYLCPYCTLTNSLNIYHHRFNCNLDHQDPFATLLKEQVKPRITLSFSGGPGSQVVANNRRRALAKKMIPTEYENVFVFDWNNKEHVQVIYNDLNNLEITCHGHNRIKGDDLDREGTIAAALLIRLNRSNADRTED